MTPPQPPQSTPSTPGHFRNPPARDPSSRKSSPKAAPTFRDLVIERAYAALGKPEVAPVESGNLYRWTLKRAYGPAMYVTIDSPERPELAHIMVSDSTKHQSKPIVSSIVYSIAEADEVIACIVKQWQQPAEEPTRDCVAQSDS